MLLREDCCNLPRAECYRLIFILMTTHRFHCDEALFSIPVRHVTQTLFFYYRMFFFIIGCVFAIIFIILAYKKLRIKGCLGMGLHATETLKNLDNGRSLALKACFNPGARSLFKIDMGINLNLV